LKVRAARIHPNQIIRINEFDLMVTEDENDDGLVVQIILAFAADGRTGLGQGAQAGRVYKVLERSRETGMAGRFLERTDFAFGQMTRHQNAQGPGENITFEKAVSR